MKDKSMNRTNTKKGVRKRMAIVFFFFFRKYAQSILKSCKIDIKQWDGAPCSLITTHTIQTAWSISHATI